MKKDNSCEAIFKEYEDCVSYNESVGLYDTVRRNESFYIGNQWEGLDAPDLDKPVLNFLKRVCAYCVAMLVSDDIAVELTPMRRSGEAAGNARLLEREITRVIERTKAKAKARDMLRSCAVDGDAAFYWYYDGAVKNGGGVSGEIELEPLDNTRVLFGNPFEWDIQKQPFVLIVKREQTSKVRERARKYRQSAEEIVPDSGRYDEEDGYNARDLVTVIMKFYKKDGRVYFTEATKTAVIRPETRTDYTLYPISYMSWERVRNSYHGQAMITGLIPNQVAVNKLWAMAIRHQHTMAFPKIFYDRGKIKEWTNRVGEAIGVVGNPSDAVAWGGRSPEMSAQLTEIVDRTIQYTKEFMGASDAALGNVNPSNASAIIAVQKATAAPLELQKLAFYQFVEDSVRIIIELIHAHYGPRAVTVTEEDGEEKEKTVDFGEIDHEAMSLDVEVGASAYWSELTQLGTLDNLFAKGILTDALLYLESIPNGVIRNKRALIDRLREDKLNAAEDTRTQ